MQRSRPARRRWKERGRQPSRSRSCVSFFSRAKDGWLSGCGNLCRRLVMMILCPRVALWQAEGLLRVICNSCYDHCSVCCRLGIMVNTKTRTASPEHVLISERILMIRYQTALPQSMLSSMCSLGSNCLVRDASHLCSSENEHAEMRFQQILTQTCISISVSLS